MRFTKLHALGNDFLVIEAGEVPPVALLDRLARSLCDRHYGAGADGLVVARFDVEDAECASRIFNADGSEAEVSGNGTRCLAAWLDDAGHWPASLEAVRIRTAAGVKTVRRSGRKGHFETEMGAPALASDAVPMRLAPPLERVVEYPLDVGGERLLVTALSVGNPHCTIFVDRLDPARVAKLGPLVERHALFPNRVNVEFVEAAGHDRLRALFWERGVGETLSSGTGASASAVAGALTGRSGRAVTVETEAGPLAVVWREEDGVVLLSGPAELVYAAEWRSPI